MSRRGSLKTFGVFDLQGGKMQSEVTERVRSARLWCHRHWPLITDPHLRRRVKFRLYRFFVLPILTYGCELWTINKLTIKRLMRFEISTLIEIYKSKYPVYHPKRLKPQPQVVYQQYGLPDVFQHVVCERVRWRTMLELEDTALKEKRQRLRWWDQTNFDEDDLMCSTSKIANK